MSSNGENTMTGRHTGLVTRMNACTENPVLRIWCALHQIDLVIKSAAEELAGGRWIMFTWSFSIFLRAQANLITSMAVKCPKKTNRWTHLGRLLQFFKDHRRRIVAYTETHRPEQMPTSAWWVITFAVLPAINTINVTFVILQNRSLLIAQQEQHIHMLISSLVAMFCVEIVQENYDDAQYVSVGSMRILVDAIVEHIRDQGSFAIACYSDLDANDKNEIIRTVARYAISLVTGLMGVKAERDGNNMRLENDAPPVLPAQLITIRHGKFVSEVLEPYRTHISSFWSLEDIDQTEADHRDLLNLYASDQILRVAIDRHTIETSFDDTWNCAPGRFDKLRSFCGSLATVFTNTTSIESDFSILKWEMTKTVPA
ncbi:unnamed protein product [Sphagnum troendelagicum]|uniref:Uncharacterized protein n=1 Tax=Sphagnum troendelagicum TaxID=128251 RepID=A0ABP0UEB7_9BRYO